MVSSAHDVGGSGKKVGHCRRRVANSGHFTSLLRQTYIRSQITLCVLPAVQGGIPFVHDSVLGRTRRLIDRRTTLLRRWGQKALSEGCLVIQGKPHPLAHTEPRHPRPVLLLPAVDSKLEQSGSHNSRYRLWKIEVQAYTIMKTAKSTTDHKHHVRASRFGVAKLEAVADAPPEPETVPEDAISSS